MSHEEDVAHGPLRVGERGRIVLPSELRESMALSVGDLLLVTVPAPGEIRLLSTKVAADSGRGLLALKGARRSLAEELIAERRREAERE